MQTTHVHMHIHMYIYIWVCFFENDKVFPWPFHWILCCIPLSRRSATHTNRKDSIPSHSATKKLSCNMVSKKAKQTERWIYCCPRVRHHSAATAITVTSTQVSIACEQFGFECPCCRMESVEGGRRVLLWLHWDNVCIYIYLHIYICTYL